MDKLKLYTPDRAEENYRKLAALFPNALTEAITGYDKDGKAIIERAIDVEVLRREIAAHVTDGQEERYQFTWPDKFRAILAANTPINKALRPCREESVEFDSTENLYLEGDNLEVLKLLQETYLGKIKTIYIDPPYNTGGDFVYADSFVQETGAYLPHSGQFDGEGNRLVQNTERNGRFHTDWLNMMYPRLKLARDLLAEDGAIFISIDDREVGNLRKLSDEVFGPANFIAQINWKGRGGRQDSKYYAVIHEHILVYAKNSGEFAAGEELKTGDVFPYFDEAANRYYKTQLLRKWGSNSRRADRPNLFYPIPAPDGTELYPMVGQEEGCWRWGPARMKEAAAAGRLKFVRKDGAWIAYEKIYAPSPEEEKTKKYVTWIDDTSNGTNAVKELFGRAVFDYPKSPGLIERFLKMGSAGPGDIVLDFFSGSATTAQAVMELNAQDGGGRKFIMVQLPEPTEEKSEAYQAGYQTICEIGKERIRRAGRKIAGARPEQGIDVGFRVLKCDSSNMKDVYYTPEEYESSLFDVLADNIKEGRTPEDLLFQVMLDLGILPSSKIQVEEIAGKQVFCVGEERLLACFEAGLTEEIITQIARRKPEYFVMRDSSMASDSVAANFDQIFDTYSPTTERRIL